MNLRYLEYLVVLEKTGNMTRAAQQLYISQSNLSQFLSNEEKKLGIKLFKRSGGKYHPTEAGEIYLDYAREMIRLNHQFNQRLSALASSCSHIRIGYTSSTAVGMMSQVLPLFQPRHPEAHVTTLDISNLDTAIYSLTSSKLDLAFVTTWKPDLYQGPARVLAREELFLGVPASHPACRAFENTPNPRLSARRLLQLFGQSPFILPYEGSCIRHLIDDFFQASHTVCTATYHASSISTIADMVASGLGLGFIPSNSIARQDTSIRYFGLSPRAWRTHAVFIRPQGSSDLLDDLIRYAVRYYRTLFA